MLYIKAFETELRKDNFEQLSQSVKRHMTEIDKDLDKLTLKLAGLKTAS